MRTATSSSRIRPRNREGKEHSAASEATTPGRGTARKPGGAAAKGRKAAAPEAEGSGLPARRKVPVPVGAVWWNRAEGHPCLRFFGTELRSQRAELRGWSLDDLHVASGLAKSFLSELESGKKMPSEEVILELEAALGMADGGLMSRVRRRWMKAVAREVAEQRLAEPLKRQMQAIRQALKRQALALWLTGCWPFPFPPPG